MTKFKTMYSTILGTAFFTNFALGTTPAVALPDCGDIASAVDGDTHGALTAALQAVAPDAAANGGLDTNMWGTIVNRDGKVCAVAMTGGDRGDQWPGSRVISAQKANTANAFSLPGLAISTANLFSAVQPGGSLFGLQFSNPVNPQVAYKGPAANFGMANDPLVNDKPGGVNVFGGGLALYDGGGTLLGALGVSGDTSCADHNIAWRVRDELGLDNVPAGPGGIFGGTVGDNIIFDTTVDPSTGHTVSTSGFGHPACGFGEDSANASIVTDCPLGPNGDDTCTP